MEQQQNENQLNIELSEEIAEGIFSNLAIITHSNTEFVLDFIRVMPGVPKAKVKSRIILTPEHAKRLLQAMFIPKHSSKCLPLDMFLFNIVNCLLQAGIKFVSLAFSLFENSIEIYEWFLVVSRGQSQLRIF